MANDRSTDDTIAADSSDATLPAPAVTAAATASELPTVDPKHYEHGPEIARGGMGRIHAANDRRVGRPVAVKELLLDHPSAIARFEREALITARLQHPAIVPVYEAGRWPNGALFFAMKHVAGRSLDKVIEERATLAERLALLPHVISVAEALAYAHSKRIIHRDLKPGNILVGEFGETVVIDWGLAKDLADDRDEIAPAITSDESDGNLTVAGAAMGTPAYMPPEQALGERVDERADVYALGAIVYQLLTGKMPYTGPTAEHVLVEVSSKPPRPVREIEPDAAPELVTIVEKAMARDPGDRYPSARELAADLRRYETGQLVQAHSYSFGALVRRWIRRHRAAIVVAATMLVAAGIAGGFAIANIVQARADAESARETAEQRSLEAQRASAEAERRRREADAAKLDADAQRAQAEAGRAQASAAAEQLVDAWVRAEHMTALRGCLPATTEFEGSVEVEIGEGGVLVAAGMLPYDTEKLADTFAGDRPAIMAFAYAYKCIDALAKKWQFPAAMMPGLYALEIKHPKNGEVTARFARASRDVIKAKIRQSYLTKAQYCYEKLLLDEPTVSGQVMVTFTILPEGTITVDKVDAFHPRMTECIRDSLATLRFPRPGERMQINYPFNFVRAAE